MVIISNGFSKFHLSVAAAEADRRQILSCFLTGAYPSPLVRDILSLPFLRANPKLNRLGARRDQIADRLVHSFFSAEALYGLGTLCNNEVTVANSLRFYGWLAIRHVERAAANGARIYHYRAGFGGESVEAAKKLGMFALCDHSAVHPSIAGSLVERMGGTPRHMKKPELGLFGRTLLRDIEQADSVLVNSSFAEWTFEFAGHDRSPVHVIYLGVDDSFMAHVPQRETASDEFRLLFAGKFGKGKGVETLMDAFARLEHIPCRLEIAGPLDSGMIGPGREFFSNPRVKYLGLMSRIDLAQAMSRADVFVFPSLSEGSARVVFEALACGCYVITTPNSGSIVEEGIHGNIVLAGDSSLLAGAIENAYYHRDLISRIGRNNALLVKSKYTQHNYGDQLTVLYKESLGVS